MPTYFDQIDCTGGVPMRTPSGTKLSVYDTVTRTMEGQYGQGGIDGNFTGARFITTSATIKSSAGFLYGINVNNKIGQRIFIYDTATNSIRTTATTCRNTVGVLTFGANDAGAPKFIEFSRKLTKGLVLLVVPTISTSVTDIAVSYR